MFVRPTLEYLLPEAARAVRACLIGDGSRTRAVAALHLCCAYPATTPSSPHVVAECAKEVRAYLDALQAAWRAELDAVGDGVRRATHDVADELRAALRLGRHVDRRALSTKLDACLAQLRSRPDPVLLRPDSLDRAARRLREDTTGHASWTDALDRVQRDVGRDFVRAVYPLLLRKEHRRAR